MRVESRICLWFCAGGKATEWVVIHHYNITPFFESSVMFARREKVLRLVDILRLARTLNIWRKNY